MLLLRCLISLVTLFFTLSFLSTAEALHARAQRIETTTKTVRETSTKTDFKTTTKTTTVDKTRTKTTTDFKTTTETTTDFKTKTETTTATQDVTINHTTTTTKTISVTGSGSTCPTSTSTSTSRSVGCVVASIGGFVTGCSASSSVSTTSSISTSHTSNTCPAPSTVTTTITQSSSSTCPPKIPASTVTSTSTSTTTITKTQSGSSTCPTTPPSTQTVTSVSTATTTVTVTATTTAQPTCPQLVYNPGFETGTFAGWTNDNDNPGVTVIVVASSSIPGGAHSGSYAAEWYTNPAGPFLPGTPSDFYQTITIPQLCSTEQQYAFQAFVKTVANSCFVNAYDNGSGTSFDSISLGPGGTAPAWVEMSAIITPGAGPFQLVLETACDTTDPVWIDDITLTPI